jgi:hypothetical protein
MFDAAELSDFRIVFCVRSGQLLCLLECQLLERQQLQRNEVRWLGENDQMMTVTAHVTLSDRMFDETSLFQPESEKNYNLNI